MPEFGTCWADGKTPTPPIMSANMYNECMRGATSMHKDATTSVGLCDAHYLEIVGEAA